MEQELVRILGVVASIQLRTLKIEVGKVSTGTALGRGLVDPKKEVDFAHKDVTLGSRKGVR